MDTTADAPRSTVESHEPLWDWLVKHNARCAWQTKAGHLHIEGWRVGAGMVVIVLYPHPGGWSLLSEHPSNNIEETLQDAERRCGIK